MENEISPKYQMKLTNDVEAAIWDEFKTYKDVKNYILKWHKHDDYGNWENFYIEWKPTGDIDLNPTLHSLSGNDLLKIAIDLGVAIPDFIPSIPTFKNDLKSEYKTAYSTFEKACKQIETDPSLAIGLANSSLESIIKEILKDERFSSKADKETLYKLAQLILKEFKLVGEDFPIEIKTIGSSLMSICQAIEKLRSEKTDFHGKTENDYLIDESVFATLVINSVTTVGLFLNSYYKNKHPKPKKISFEKEHDDLPF
jgi:hypothetical protein